MSDGDQVEILLRKTREKARIVASAAFIYPAEVLKLFDGTDPGDLIEEEPINFIRNLQVRNLEIYDANYQQCAEIAWEVAGPLVNKLLDWLPKGNDIEEATQALNDIRRLTLQRKIIERIRLEGTIKQLPPELVELRKGSRKLDVRNAHYALQPQAPIEWFVEKIIAARSLNVWVGKFGSKKTWVILSMAVCVAAKKTWIGISTKQANVLIIDEESGDHRLAMRLGAALRGELADENTPVFFVSLAGFNFFKNLQDTTMLNYLVQELGVGLVIIDALTDIMAGGDENSVKDTQPVFTILRKVAEDTGAAILIIHHTNKAGEYRGSTAIPGALDSMVLVDSEEGSNFVNFKTVKNREGEPMKFSAEAHWTEDQFYLTYVENLPSGKSYGKAQNYVLRYLTENGPSSLPDIMGAADSCTPKSANLAVYALVELGKVRRKNPGAPIGTPAIYEVVEDE
jgi:hypothetical protein